MALTFETLKRDGNASKRRETCNAWERMPSYYEERLHIYIPKT